MDELVALLTDTAERLFARHITPALRREAEAGTFPAAAWDAVVEAGLPRALLPEAAGGAGLSPAQALPLLRVAAAHAAPLPLAEAMAAAWLLHRAGMEVPDGIVTLGLGPEPERVPWGRDAAFVLLADGPRLALHAPGSYQVIPGRNLAGEPRDALRLTGPAIARGDAPAEAALRLIAAMRTQQIAGALAALTEATLRYAQERSQFGRPIGRFQAVQQSLAVLAAEAAAAGAAAGLAAEAAGTLAPLPIAAAKSRAGEAAGIGAAIAHQIHGAIGFTQEHRLHTLTRRLWSWREEAGSERFWNLRLGTRMAEAGAEGLWPLLAAA